MGLSRPGIIVSDVITGELVIVARAIGLSESAVSVIFFISASHDFLILEKSVRTALSTSAILEVVAERFIAACWWAFSSFFACLQWSEKEC